MAPFAMLAGSSLNVDISSANNYGSIDSWTNVVLAGAFNATLNNGYVPANGATFSVVSYASERGTFSSLGLPSSVNWQTQYGRTNFTLVVGGAKLQFRSLGKWGTNLVFSGSGGSPGSNYVVLTSTNVALRLTNWTPLVTNYFDASGNFGFTNGINPAQAKRFFLLKTH
jgi:hypothetical protein